MRTTITLNPEADRRIRAVMSERGLSFKDAVNAAILDGLRPASAPPYRTPVFDLGVARVPVDRALALAGELEDEELLRRRDLGR